MSAAELLLDERHQLDDRSFVELVVWQLPASTPGSKHSFKYRLAFVVNGRCVLRYDNERGKGDHRHVGNRETPYRFTDVDTLLTDFQRDVEQWRQHHEKDRDV